MEIEKKLILFKNQEFGNIRGYEQRGEIWFLGKDVATCLGYKNTRDALSKHVDEDDKNTVAIYDGTSGNPNQVIINESGLYSLVLSSKLPNVKQFKKWITKEVLPKIRRTGGYILGEENMTEEELVLKAMEVMQKKINLLKKKNKELKENNKEQQNLIEELKPKATYLDTILQNESTISTTVIAKDYGMTAIEFNQLLYRLHIQFKQGKQWFLYVPYQDKGFTHSSVYETTSKGKTSLNATTKWTQKGRLFLYNALKSRGILPMIERTDDKKLDLENMELEPYNIEII